jgi:hypothetical protein
MNVNSKIVSNIKKMTRFMKKEGIFNLKTSEFEITLDLHYHPTSSSKKKDVISEEETKEPSYTDEDILFWSTPGFSDSH